MLTPILNFFRARRRNVSSLCAAPSKANDVEWWMLHNVAAKRPLTSHVSRMKECAAGVQNLLARGWITGDASKAQMTVAGVAALNDYLALANNVCRYAIMPDGTVVACHIGSDAFRDGERRHGRLPDGAVFPV